MKMVGILQCSAFSLACNSRPDMPGMRISAIRHAVWCCWPEFRNSSADSARHRRRVLVFLLCSEWYLISKAAFALMPITLVIQYRVEARKLTICPSQRIDVWTFRPCLKKVPFQLVQLFANHKTTPTLIALLMPRRKQTRTLPECGSCFVKRARRTSRRPEPLSLRRYRRPPETIPAPVAPPPSRLLQCAPGAGSYQPQRALLCTSASNRYCPETWKYRYS